MTPPEVPAACRDVILREWPLMEPGIADRIAAEVLRAADTAAPLPVDMAVDRIMGQVADYGTIVEDHTFNAERGRATAHCAQAKIAVLGEIRLAITTAITTALAAARAEQREEAERYRSVLLNVMLPLEAFWADVPSRAYVAPQIRRKLSSAIEDARAALTPPLSGGTGGGG
jgi:hypothetical protein